MILLQGSGELTGGVLIADELDAGSGFTFHVGNAVFHIEVFDHGTAGAPSARPVASATAPI